MRSTVIIYNKYATEMINISSEIGINKIVNDDYFSYSSNNGVMILGVYDGHGGSETARYISKQLPAMLAHYFEGMREIDLEKTLSEITNYIWKLDKEIVLNGIINDLSGTTVAICILLYRFNTIITCNIGDSLIAIRKGGEWKKLTTEHRINTDSIDYQRIKKLNIPIYNDNMIVNNKSINISRSIGDSDFKQIPYVIQIEQPIIPQPDFTVTSTKDVNEIFLCTDGITNIMNLESIAKILEIKIDPEKKLNELMKRVINSFNTDDATCIYAVFLNNINS